MRYRMLDMRYRSVNIMIGYRIHRISYRKCAYDMVYDIRYVCTTISYVNLRYQDRMSTYDTMIVGYQESRCRRAEPPTSPGPGGTSSVRGRRHWQSPAVTVTVQVARAWRRHRGRRRRRAVAPGVTDRPGPEGSESSCAAGRDRPRRANSVVTRTPDPGPGHGLRALQ